MEYPVKIFSDLHYKYFGARYKNPQDLHSLFTNCRTAIFVGDTVEEHVWGKRKAESHLAEVISVAKQFGVICVFLRGNHDPSFGAPELSFIHANKHFWLTHGDFGVLPLKSSSRNMFQRPFEYGLHFIKTLRSYPVYWKQISMALEMSRKEDVIVLGHTHQRSITRHGGKVIINLGAHMKGFKSAHILLPDQASPAIYCGSNEEEI